ncbi:TonB-dependent receptor [Phenylobacterium sp.]|uniref:TonB-dependent receptor n=1 Tax=Phenylobacterium sp. TaxID=1871053 RepID=UPI0025CF0350|nr:TonB-dependent receptor [Phenylobacterium sp.]MCA3721860.1 TonB-dependent receptor [Phenylobacterium sp.]
MSRRLLAALAAPVLAAFPALAAGPQAERRDKLVDELVVEAPPDAVGGVVGDIRPELSLDEAEIQSFGVSNVAELVAQLAPQTQSGRGRTRGGPPVVLLNGARVSGFSELRDLPSEAILRVDVLPEEAALKYGFAADQRVLNFVTRKTFRAITGEIDLEAATAGGTVTREVETGLFRIDGDQRTQLRVDWTDASAVTEAERDVPPALSAAPFTPGGSFRGRGPGGEIDPALSALTGVATRLSGVPDVARVRPPTLAEVAPLAGKLAPDGEARFRTLTPETRRLQVNGVVARNVTPTTTGTLNLVLSLGDSEALQGRAPFALVVPGPGPWSPFSSSVDLLRRDASRGAIRRTTEDWNARLGFGLNGARSAWRLSLTGGIDLADQVTRTDGGVDARPAQARLTAGDPAFNPYADLSPADLPAFAPDRTRSRTAGADLQALAAGALAELPAGPLFVSVKAGAAGNWLKSRSVRRNVERTTELSRTGLNGQASLDLPLLRREPEGLGRLGDVSLNFNLQGESLSDAGALGAVGAGVNWSPIERLTLLASFSRDQSPPTLLQLGAPRAVTTGVRVFDFVRGETIEVTQVSGGDPGLANDTRDATRLGVNWKPFTEREINISINYTQSRAEDAAAALPALTSEVQAAFPERFLRDASGRLVLIDARPVSFLQSDREEVRWGFNWFSGAGPQRGLRGPPGGAPRGATGAGQGGRIGPAMGGPGSRNGFQVSLYHTAVLRDRVLVREGGPIFDLLGGSAAGARGGTPAHAIDLQAGLFRNGRGVRLSGTWRQGTQVRGDTPDSALTFSDFATLDLRVFETFAGSPDLVRRWPFLKGARLTFAVDNLFDARLEVRDGLGATPAGYASDILDPVGRVIEVSFRKVF